LDMVKTSLRAPQCGNLS